MMSAFKMAWDITKNGPLPLEDPADADSIEEYMWEWRRRGYLDKLRGESEKEARSYLGLLHHAIQALREKGEYWGVFSVQFIVDNLNDILSKNGLMDEDPFSEVEP
jgi:hypothetical protein